MRTHSGMKLSHCMLRWRTSRLSRSRCHMVWRLLLLIGSHRSIIPHMLRRMLRRTMWSTGWSHMGSGMWGTSLLMRSTLLMIDSGLLLLLLERMRLLMGSSLHVLSAWLMGLMRSTV